MHPYLGLIIAIIFEVIGKSLLTQTAQFTRPLPTVLMLLSYGAGLWFLSFALKGIPVGLAYAIWSGLGIVLISAIGWVFLRQHLDAAALLGLSLIIGGVMVIHLFSNSMSH